MSGEDPVVRGQEDWRTAGGLEGEQVARIGMHKYLRNASLLTFACPDRERARKTNLPLVPEDSLRAAGEQIGNGPRSVSCGNGRLRRKAKLTRQVAPRRSEGENTRARQEVIERLLLDGIDAEAARAAVAEELDPPCFGTSHEAQAALPVAQLAGAGAHIALHPPIL